MFLVILQEMNEQRINIGRFNPKVRTDTHVTKVQNKDHLK